MLDNNLENRPGCLPKIFQPRRPSTPQEPFHILPQSIRYMLRHGKGLLPLKDFRTLHLDNYPHAQFYMFQLAMKFLHRDSDRQKTLLKNVLEMIISGREKEIISACKDSVSHLDEKDPKIAVEATKIAFINRVGPQHYASTWGDLAAETRQDHGTPVLMAYSSLLGIKSFAHDLISGGKVLVAIKGTAQNDPFKGPWYGFLVKLNGENIIVDDIRAESNKIEELQDDRLVLIAHSKNSSTKHEFIARCFDAPGLVRISATKFLDSVGDAAQDLPPTYVITDRYKQTGRTIREISGEIWWRIMPHEKVIERDPDLRTVVPAGVRMDLATLQGSVEVRSLVAATAIKPFSDLLIYLGTKALDGKSDLQISMLKDVADSILEERRSGSLIHGSDLKGVGPIIKKTLLDSLGAECRDRVKASKIALVYRVGPNYFRSKFDELIAAILSEGHAPCLIGYAGLSGFGSMIRHLKNDSSFVVYIPDQSTFFKFTKDGSSINAEEFSNLNELEGLFPEGKEIALIDDVVKSGETFKATARIFRKLGLPKVVGFFCVDRS